MHAKLFTEYNIIKNALSLFVLTLAFCFAGGHLRIPQELSLFWPVNAILTAVIVRKPFLHRIRYYVVCLVAMTVNDTLFSGWAWLAVTLNIANILFIVIAVSMLVKQFHQATDKIRISNALRIFPACLLAAFVCASWGSIAQGIGMDTQFAIAWGDWFSEQFSTGLMLLPFLLACRWRTIFASGWSAPGKWLPLLMVALSLVVGALMGGAGSLTFPVPALIWCAIVLPVSLTNFVILLTGISEIVLVSHGVMGIHGSETLLPLSPLASVRLGVATVVISPLIVAVSMDAIYQLNQRLALRANYDFLTRLLSRSGLYESLQNEPFVLQREAGVILLDVDYFKAINDNFGHDAGDGVLEEIGCRLQKVVGARGRICRFGGEEFVVVTFGLPRQQLYQLAENIRQSIVNEKFWLSGNQIAVTVSLGLAMGYAGEDRAWPGVINRLISAADKNLYFAKRNGRNQVSPAGSSPSPLAGDLA